MYLSRLEVRNLRNLTSVSLSPSPSLNIIEGNNGSGKTSLLEAIYLLGLARSFRTLKSASLVKNSEESLTLFSVIHNGNQDHRLGLQRYRNNTTDIRLDGQNVQRRAEIANLLPLQLITPDSISLLTGSPTERRQFVDWVLFHVEQQFHSTWSRYTRILKQRNAILRQNKHDELQSWDVTLVSAGESIDIMRRNIIEALLPHIHYFCSILIPNSNIALRYRQGWKPDNSFSDALLNSLDQDKKQHFTSFGPHRAELIVTDNGLRVSEHYSRGQLKLLTCCFRLAQMSLLREHSDKSSIVLLDDLPAELDSSHRKLLLDLLHDLDNQVFITATERIELNTERWKDAKVFHVEHGEIKEVV